MQPPILDWAKNDFRSLEKKKRRILKRLQGLQKSLCEFPLSSYLINLEDELNKELCEIYNQEECFWMIRSRVDWLSQGDRNTSYFHKSVKINRKVNRISNLTDEV